MLSLHTAFCLLFAIKWAILNSHQPSNSWKNLLPNTPFLSEVWTPRLGQWWLRKKSKEYLNKGLEKVKSFPVMLTKKVALHKRITNKLKRSNKIWMNWGRRPKSMAKNRKFGLEEEGKAIGGSSMVLITMRKSLRKPYKSGNSAN